MTAPLALDIGAQFQDIFEAMQIELCIFCESAGLAHGHFVVFGGDFGREMVLGGKEVNDLLLVLRVEQPALRFDVSSEKCDEEITMFLGPGALGEKASG